jgi:hypothetical protein
VTAPRDEDALTREGYKFWLPTIALILVFEILGALSGWVHNKIPWPTISATVGELEKRWDWVAVIVLGLITAVAYHALTHEKKDTLTGRALRAGAPVIHEEPWYSWWLVLALALAAFVASWLAGLSKVAIGYVGYGTLAAFGIVVPSLLSFGLGRRVGFPTLFFTIDRLRRKIHVVAVVLLTGLAILAIHLAFYPWPDITHESASFAGLNAASARDKAERKVRSVRAGLPALAYSAQARGVSDGHDAWFVYFGGSGGRYSGCVVVVTKSSVVPSDECKK